MAVDGRLPVVLCWHMHQPDYRGPDASDYQLPWVYLHGIKDYLDMAAHLEANPQARAVVNFAPVLLEQIEDYGNQLAAWLEHGKRIRDPLLAALAGPGLPMDQSGRQALVHACRRANEQRLVKRFKTFQRLQELANMVERHQDNAGYLNDQFLVDLLVWYHLAWMGEHARANDLRVISLEKKRHHFGLEDRRALVTLIAEILSGLIPRYRALAESGRVELSVTPYAHPIIPLLIDFASARPAMPVVQLPGEPGYPGGQERAQWHVREGLKCFQRHFGFLPGGCWPAEGAVCDATLKMLAEHGIQWAASGQQVLHNSLRHAGEDTSSGNWPHRGYLAADGRMGCFFRDDGLSDLIGFTYADWHAEDAVANLLRHLENIADATREMPDAVVSIIMDGENAWEYYPRNGCFFLEALYREMASHPRLQLTTFSELLGSAARPTRILPPVVPGSWVYGTFSTWIGDPDKNRGWEMLCQAKQACDRYLQSTSLDSRQRDRVLRQLATCEGSDWFWWFGDYNPGETVSDFEQLFRSQLRHLYQMIDTTPPAYLDQVFAQGSGDPSRGGVMRQNV